MMNPNLKTQVQARINAITGATALNELLQLQTQSSGLGCDTSLLDAQIQSRLTAMNGATPINDLTLGALLAQGGKGRAYYQVPFAVAKGDKLYIDAFGTVKQQKSAGNALISANAFTNEFGQLNHIPIPERASVGGGDSHASGFVVQLSTGNWLIGRFYRESSSSGGTIRLVVVNSTFTQIITETKYSYTTDMSLAATGNNLVGVREVSANTFRVYIQATEPSTGNYIHLAYFSLAYNTTSHAVTGASGAIVHSLSGGAQWVQKRIYLAQGDRYVSLTDSSNRIYALDLQAGTLTNYATIGTAGTGETQFDQANGTNVWGRVINAGTAMLYRADTIATQALPSNLLADGCFGSSWSVRHIGSGRWLCVSSTAIKLVKFNAAYTTAAIYSLDSAFQTPSSLNIATIVVDGNNYTIGIGFGPATLSQVIAFTWDGNSAPTNYRSDAGFRVTDRANFVWPGSSSNQSMSHVITPSQKVVCTAKSDDEANQSRLMILRIDLAEYMPHETSVFATCLTAAASGQLAEVELTANTEVVGSAGAASYFGKLHQGLLTTLPVRAPRINADVYSYSEMGPVDQALFHRREQSVPLTQAYLVLPADTRTLFSAGGDIALLTPFSKYDFAATALKYVPIATRTVCAVRTGTSPSLQAQETL
ncbi:hypothetical protein [Rheinheimera tilapiae]|uniref:Uncharacterized protein n=1 Tax=Rheinheimera tilapiae TaxID=875043 RepID=A0ABV6BBM5_9GAMM